MADRNRGSLTKQDLKYLKLLAHEYPTIEQVSTEIIKLEAILCLPKATEHFISDIHGEYTAFLHMLKSASGVVREKVEILFEDTVPKRERDQLATLIYYPKEKLELLKEERALSREWYLKTLHRLVEVCKLSASKYTRSKVRASLPPQFEFIIAELLNTSDDRMKTQYNNEIFKAILDTEQQDAFIIELAKLIQRLVIDHLHIVGDIFDRGPGAPIILDTLRAYHHVDIQWGNHDILWMGAAAGSRALIATAIINCLKYGNTDTIEAGYGISLRPLMTFALEVYGNDPCERFMPKLVDKNMDPHNSEIVAKMHKAMAVILFKIEDKIIREHPEFKMDDRRLLRAVDAEAGTVNIRGQVYPICDAHLPTVDPKDPCKLTEQEENLINQLRAAFHHSEKLQEHTKFLYSKGSIYLRYNGNLMFHGCIPTDEEGNFKKIEVAGDTYSGKAYFDAVDMIAREAFFSKWNSSKRRRGLDFMWYLWCGPDSPVFGKDRMTTFERYFVKDPETHVETKDPYFRFADTEAFALKILKEFGLGDAPNARVINGHVPVKIKKGESPVKANGRVIVIDGGMSKAYQSVTGIAGYTLIYSSNEMALSCHDPFVPVEEAIGSEVDLHSTNQVVFKPDQRLRVSDIDMGEEIRGKIKDLKKLLMAYREGTIKQSGK